MSLVYFVGEGALIGYMDHPAVASALSTVRQHNPIQSSSIRGAQQQDLIPNRLLRRDPIKITSNLNHDRASSQTESSGSFKVCDYLEARKREVL